MKSKEKIEQLAEQYIKENTGDHYVYCGYIDGYNQCQQDMVNKKYTEKDIRKAIKFGQTMELLPEYVPIPDFIKSLNKQDNEHI